MGTRKKATIANQASIESLRQSAEVSSNLRQRILELAGQAGCDGITISEAERKIDDHKGHSISPRFSELVRKGALVRCLTGRGKPTRSSPLGVPCFITRYDQETRRHVTVHWLPEFAPAPNGSNSSPASVAPSGLSDRDMERNVGGYND